MGVPIDWHPHIGDPTVIGWTITVAYFVVTFLCYRAGLAVKRSFSDPGNRRDRIVWFGLAGVLLALGINKQLDLQTLVIHTGRKVALLNGWHDFGREIQLYFVLGLAFSGVILVGVLFWLSHGGWKQYWPVLLGSVMLMTFVLIRAASFDHVDYLLSQWRTVGSIRMKYVLELLGILIVGVGAARVLRLRRR